MIFPFLSKFDFPFILFIYNFLYFSGKKFLLVFIVVRIFNFVLVFFIELFDFLYFELMNVP